MSMNPQQIIDILRKLQAIDDEIRDVRSTRNRMVSNLEKLEAVLETRDTQLNEMRNKLSEAETWHRKKSVELEEEREKLNKAKAKLNSVTRSKEYVAVNRELDNVRRNIQTREDEVEKLTLAIAEFRSTIEREDEKVRDLRVAANAEAESNRDRLGGMDARIEAVERRRNEVAEGIEKSILKRYRKVFDARDGTAVVGVVDEDACGGCNMVVQPRFVEAIMRGTSLVQCPFCSRFLYIDSRSDQDGQPELAA